MTLADRLADALRRGADAAPELLTGDLTPLELEDAPLRAEAAVLIAVTDRAEPGVILTQRTDTLRNHAGQVAFPGGRIDPGDADATAAALREAREEIGLDPAVATIVAPLDPYRTVTGFRVTPVVGVVPPDLPLTPSEAEVAAVFEVPLAHILDRKNHVRASAEYRGRTRHFYEIPWEGRRIWGATGAMIVNLSRRLAW